MPGSSCGLNALAFAAADLEISSAVAPNGSSMDACVGLTASVLTVGDSSFYSGSNPSDGYESDGLSTDDEIESSSHSEALGPTIHARKNKSMKRKREYAAIEGHDQEAWPVQESGRMKRVAPNQETQLGKESFAHGFSEGFLAGCKYIQSQMKDRRHSQMDILDNSSAESPMASPKARRGLIRRPYRFCTKCWIMHKKWVLKSIKLPTGSVVNLHPEVCPDWDKPSEEPTKEQLRVYGAAFKRAQRSSLLHDVALNTYTSVMPGVPVSTLQEFLHGHQLGSN